MTSSLLQRNELLARAEIDGELVLMCPDSGKYYSLTGVARRVWDLLAEPATMESLCATLAREYRVESDVCSNDVASFLQSMQTRSLVNAISPQQ